MRRRFLPVFAIAHSCLAPSSLRAHETRPAFLELIETSPGRIEVTWKVPARGGTPLAGEEELAGTGATPAGSGAAIPLALPCGCPAPVTGSRAALPLHPELPESWRLASLPSTERLQGAEIRRWTVSTGAPVEAGGTIAVHGLEATMTDVLVRVVLADGRVISRLLRPDAPSFTIAADREGPPVGAYFILGVEHILLGVDHLLFVLALVLIVRGAGLLVKTVTAFTVAHSITLALATLGVVRVPAAPVEAVIALSIVFVAAEVLRAREGRPGLGARAPWLVAFTFGLLHGFGFAGALAEVGLPEDDIPLALLSFNLGVEAGQLAFVAAALSVIAAIRRVRLPLPFRAEPALPYAIGSIAMFWVIERLAAL